MNYEDYLSPKFVVQLKEEMMRYLKWFKESTEIVEREKTTTTKYKELILKNFDG